MHVRVIVTAVNNPVILSRDDNIQLSHSFLTSFNSYQEIKFSTRNLKEYYSHQSMDPKNSASGRIRRQHTTAGHFSILCPIVCIS